MNQEEQVTVKDLEKIVVSNSETLEQISVCLMGDPKDHKDEGLIGAVNNNVKWKNNINKSVGGLGLGFFALVIKEAWQHLVGK
jgi:hypothetical protein